MPRTARFIPENNDGVLVEVTARTLGAGALLVPANLADGLDRGSVSHTRKHSLDAQDRDFRDFRDVRDFRESGGVA